MKCPECQDGKHVNCGPALDEKTDQIVDCDCTHTDDNDQAKAMYFNIILDYGHAIQYVPPGTYDDQETALAYTVGRTMLNRPELVISGPFTVELATEILNAAIKLDDDAAIVAGKPEKVMPELPLFFPIAAQHAPLFGVFTCFGKMTAVPLQLLWPDDKDCYPGDPAYNHDQIQQVFA